MLAVAAAGVAVATSADAQSYLNWPGRPAPTTGAGAAAPTGLIPHAGVQPLSNPVGDALAAIPDRRPSQGLTPASAWLPARTDAAPPPSPAPVRIAAAPPPPPTRPEPRPAPVQPVPAQPAAGQPAPVQPTPVQPAPAQPSPAAPARDPADPMAPRSDAPIFRMGRDAPTPTPTPVPAQPQAPAAAPAQPSAYAAPPPSPTLGSRRYSVHRQNGQQPDAIQRPQPVYLDALPVDLAETPQSEDLAAPPAPPSMLRNADGRYVPAPAAIEHDVQ